MSSSDSESDSSSVYYISGADVNDEYEDTEKEKKTQQAAATRRRKLVSQTKMLLMFSIHLVNVKTLDVTSLAMSVDRVIQVVTVQFFHQILCMDSTMYKLVIVSTGRATGSLWF